MIKDITIGQYFPGFSVLHRMDARMKLVLAICTMTALFLCKNFFSLGLLVFATVCLCFLSCVPLSLLFRAFRPILMLVVCTNLLNIFFTKGIDTQILLRLPFFGSFITVTREGVFAAVFASLRILCLVVLSSLLTYTTTSSMLTAALERLLSPLEKIKVKVPIFAMMITLALRFVPTLIDETSRIMNAQKSRGANFETGRLLQRIKAFIPVLVPLFVSAFRRAGELAFAMESRCYTGIGHRTSLKKMQLRVSDFCALLLVFFLFLGIIVLNHSYEKVI